MIKAKVKLNNDLPAEEPTGKPEVIPAEEKIAAKSEFPEVAGIGRFQSVKVGEGYAVYNPSGQRVTGIISLDQAGDIVRKQNIAGHMKG